jgi:hypothetical protein
VQKKMRATSGMNLAGCVAKSNTATNINLRFQNHPPKNTQSLA